MMDKVPFSYILTSLWRGQSLTRAYLNWECRNHTLEGMVLDIGAGKKEDYHEMPKGEGVQVSTLDGKISHDGSPIDFETDTLPYEDRTFDVVLMYNVLEHIYNYHHLLVEARRVVKPDGVLFGFVPFLQRYHPDPHDYFRYTHEALQKMLRDAGYDGVVVKSIGLGMFTAQFQTMALSLPRLVRVILYPCYHFMDLVYTNLRSHTAGWYPLGYYFQARCLGNTGIMNTLK